MNRPAPRSPYRAFEIRWAEAAFDTIFPRAPEIGFPVGICDLDTGGFLQDIRRRVPGQTALGLRLAIWIIAFAPIFVIGRFATFAGLASSDRARVLDRLLDSPIYAVRQLVMLFKVTGALLYGGDPRIRERVGFPSQAAAIPERAEAPALVPLRTKSNHAA